ncbi:RNA methyltransferase [Faucicola atlantae]|uniref:tRNA (cytidine/uridine-2'-O-)-methyltransferase TrmJ n=1 Tax=Faucicola atlantae TaxID=34059 RepID=A0A1B8QLD0_9GAMM|nr:RNA methyltransferase [Moraxella atlantae]OBX84594.1 rRNA methyltransferase [Moraxella atlantae]
MTDTTPSNALDNFLATIRVVMVNTTLPANIGAAARAMHTMGLRHLTLVAPKYALDDTAFANAAGSTEVLHNAQIVDDLATAVADCTWVLATSSRVRHMPKPVITPQQAADFLLDYHRKQSAQNHTPTVALVFGREDRGLTNQELMLADYHVQIPANPAYPVLNVAAAVQVIASTLYAHALAAFAMTDELNLANANTLAVILRQHWDAPAVSQHEQIALEQQFLTVLQSLDLYQPEQSKHMPQRINRLFGRLQLDQKEYQLLQALLAKLTKN